MNTCAPEEVLGGLPGPAGLGNVRSDTANTECFVKIRLSGSEGLFVSKKSPTLSLF